MELISKQDFLKYQNDKEVVNKTARQVIKDFALFNIDITFPEDLNMAYDDLFDQLTLIIANLLDENATKLYSILYQIDLSEASIRKGIAEMTGHSLNDALTHLILERELKKVLTREFFKKGKL